MRCPRFVAGAGLRRPFKRKKGSSIDQPDERKGGEGTYYRAGGVLDTMHGRSHTMIDPSTPTTPGRSMSGFNTVQGGGALVGELVHFKIVRQRRGRGGTCKGSGTFTILAIFLQHHFVVALTHCLTNSEVCRDHPERAATSALIRSQSTRHLVADGSCSGKINTIQ